MSVFITQNGANALLNWAFNTNTLWVGLGSATSSGVPIGGSFPELSGSGYSRQTTSWNTLSGIAYPASGITFGPATGTWTIVSVGIFNTQASGSLWWAGDLIVSGNVGPGNFVSFNTSGLSVGFLASGAATSSGSVLVGNLTILGNLTVDGNIQQN